MDSTKVQTWTGETTSRGFGRHQDCREKLQPLLQYWVALRSSAPSYLDSILQRACSDLHQAYERTNPAGEGISRAFPPKLSTWNRRGAERTPLPRCGGWLLFTVWRKRYSEVHEDNLFALTLFQFTLHRTSYRPLYLANRYNKHSILATFTYWTLAYR